MAGFALRWLVILFIQVTLIAIKVLVGFTERKPGNAMIKVTHKPVGMAGGTGFIQLLQWSVLGMTTGTRKINVESAQRPPGKIMGKALTLFLHVTEVAVVL